MAKVKSLQSSEESKAKKAAEDLRFGNKTEKQKKFLKENPNVKTAAEMEKKIADKKSVGASRMGPFMNKGGRAMLRGGGICKKGMNKKAVGKNS